MKCDKCGILQPYVKNPPEMMMVSKIVAGREVGRASPNYQSNFFCLPCFQTFQLDVKCCVSECKKMAPAGSASKCWSCCLKVNTAQNSCFCDEHLMSCQWCPYKYCQPCHERHLCSCQNECLEKRKPSEAYATKLCIGQCSECLVPVHHSLFTLKIRGNVLHKCCAPVSLTYCCKCRQLPKVKALVPLSEAENPHTWPETHLYCKCGEEICPLDKQLKSAYADIVEVPGGCGAYPWDVNSNSLYKAPACSPSRWGLTWRGSQEIKHISDATRNHCDDAQCTAFTDQIFKRWKTRDDIKKFAQSGKEERNFSSDRWNGCPVEEGKITPGFIESLLGYSNYPFKARLIEELVHQNESFFTDHVRWYHRLHKVRIKFNSECAHCPPVYFEKNLCCNCMDNFVVENPLESLKSILIPPLLKIIHDYYNCFSTKSSYRLKTNEWQEKKAGQTRRCNICSKEFCSLHGTGTSCVTCANTIIS